MSLRPIKSYLLNLIFFNVSKKLNQQIKLLKSLEIIIIFKNFLIKFHYHFFKLLDKIEIRWMTKY